MRVFQFSHWKLQFHVWKENKTSLKYPMLKKITRLSLRQRDEPQDSLVAVNGSLPLKSDLDDLHF